MDLKEQYDKLLRYCYMKTKDRFMAEDIVQESFLRFWQNKSYTDTGKEMAYLYTIARNLCMDEFRKKKVLNIDDYSDLSAGSDSEQERITDEIAIESALDHLPEELKEIVVMRYISEMSAADIGKVVGMSRFSVNRRLKEGLAILRKIMEGGDSHDR